MDQASQYVVTGLGALARTEDKLRSFGYQLYLDTKARTWTQPRGLTICGKGHPATMPAVSMGFAIPRDATGDQAIVFSILIAWDATHWSVQSSIEDEDIGRDNITDTLWESPEYTGMTLEEMITSLDKAAANLMSCIKEERVATLLAKVARCH